MSGTRNTCFDYARRFRADAERPANRRAPLNGMDWDEELASIDGIHLHIWRPAATSNADVYKAVYEAREKYDVVRWTWDWVPVCHEVSLRAIDAGFDPRELDMEIALFMSAPPDATHFIVKYDSIRENNEPTKPRVIEGSREVVLEVLQDAGYKILGA